jgi:hypothetical protein
VDATRNRATGWPLWGEAKFWIVDQVPCDPDLGIACYGVLLLGLAARVGQLVVFGQALVTGVAERGKGSHLPPPVPRAIGPGLKMTPQSTQSPQHTH